MYLIKKGERNQFFNTKQGCVNYINIVSTKITENTIFLAYFNFVFCEFMGGGGVVQLTSCMEQSGG
jgi:hypothetical protein